MLALELRLRRRPLALIHRRRRCRAGGRAPRVPRAPLGAVPQYAPPGLAMHPPLACAPRPPPTGPCPQVRPRRRLRRLNGASALDDDASLEMVPPPLAALPRAAPGGGEERPLAAFARYQFCLDTFRLRPLGNAWRAYLPFSISHAHAQRTARHLYLALRGRIILEVDRTKAEWAVSIARSSDAGAASWAGRSPCASAHFSAGRKIRPYCAPRLGVHPDDGA